MERVSGFDFPHEDWAPKRDEFLGEPVYVGRTTADSLHSYFSSEYPDKSPALHELNRITLPFLNRALRSVPNYFGSEYVHDSVSKEVESAVDPNDLFVFNYTVVTLAGLPEIVRQIQHPIIKYIGGMCDFRDKFSVPDVVDRISEMKQEVEKVTTGFYQPHDHPAMIPPLVRTYMFFYAGRRLSEAYDQNPKIIQQYIQENSRRLMDGMDATLTARGEGYYLSNESQQNMDRYNRTAENLLSWLKE